MQEDMESNMDTWIWVLKGQHLEPGGALVRNDGGVQ